MNYRTIVMILAGCFMLACDRSDQQAAVQQNNPESSALGASDLPQVIEEEIMTMDSYSKRKKLDTKITAEMLKDIRFDTSKSESDVAIYTDKPFNLYPAGSTHISVTPKLFFKRELDLTKKYMENIDGAFIQFEMKFK